MKELLIYECETCGNILCMIQSSGIIPVCCDNEMRYIAANTTDGAKEKHIPVLRQDGTRIQVTVGSAPHPMETKHKIEWIAVLTDRGIYARSLASGDMAECVFTIRPDEKIISVYSYCNLHGLWKSEIAQ